MCTQDSPDEVTVCDVAIAAVRSELADMPAISFDHRPHEGTRITNAEPSQSAHFLQRIGDAIAPHGGALSRDDQAGR